LKRSSMLEGSPFAATFTADFGTAAVEATYPVAGPAGAAAVFGFAFDGVAFACAFAAGAEAAGVDAAGVVAVLADEAAGAFDTTTGAGVGFGLSISMDAPPTAAMTATSAKILTGRLMVRSTVFLSAVAERRFTPRYDA
jgi:hypothetical protein